MIGNGGGDSGGSTSSGDLVYATIISEYDEELDIKTNGAVPLPIDTIYNSENITLDSDNSQFSVDVDKENINVTVEFPTYYSSASGTSVYNYYVFVGLFYSDDSGVSWECGEELRKLSYFPRSTYTTDHCINFIAPSIKDRVFKVMVLGSTSLKIPKYAYTYGTLTDPNGDGYYTTRSLPAKLTIRGIA